MQAPMAVIGAQYGDEGKGRTVDWLADQTDNPIVVRSNGGAQAGHTVVSNGRRHVFHHFGSGTLSLVPTHLSRFMICNPILFNQEWDELADVSPVLTVDPNAPVTTPFDMIINQALETKRAQGRHGSCGLGIGETIERTERGFGLTVGDLSKVDVTYLKDLREKWVATRLAEHGLTDGDEFINHLAADNILDRYIHDTKRFLDRAIIRDDSTLGNENLIFEGAQGLLLDQSNSRFPYVTRSNTGIKNVLEILDLAGLDSLEAYYVARCYQTRHGAGPMEYERDMNDYVDIVDETNVPNNWQGSIRQGALNIDVLNEVIYDDTYQKWTGTVTEKCVITCIDQIKNDRIGVVLEKEYTEISTSELLAECAADHYSKGPTCYDMAHA